MTELAATRILKEDWEVGPHLKALRLDREKLLRVRSVAVAAAADATLYHPANASGTLSYQHGTFALRNEFVGDEWKIERPNGVEAIRNETIRKKVVFANVDIACDDLHEPKPRSGKGAGAERLCASNDLFDGMLPRYSPVEPASGGWTTYFLMVAQDGAVELSCPLVKGGTFQHFFERLYLSDGGDFDADVKLPLDENDMADEFDPQVARK